MSQEIVKYDNYMNKLSFKGFEEHDFNLLMAICSRMRDLGEEQQTFEYEYLMDLIGWDRSQRIDLFHQLLKRMMEKLRHVGATVDVSADEFITFNLFSTFRANKKKRLLTVRINQDFAYILNDLTSHFTRFELKEYVGLDGRYTKQLYQQIRQRYKLRAHFWQPSIDELRQVLSIPERLEVKDITRDIVKPSVEAMKGCKGLSDLQVEVVRERRRGRPVKGYKFTWTAAKQIKGQMSLDDLGVETETIGSGSGKPKKNTKKPTKFHNFEGHNYDFDSIESKLLKGE